MTKIGGMREITISLLSSAWAALSVSGWLVEHIKSRKSFSQTETNTDNN